MKYRLLLISHLVVLSLLLSPLNSLLRSETPDTTFKKSSKHLLFYGGMGLGYTSIPSYNDYLRYQIASGAYDSVKSFSVGIEIFGGLDYEISKRISLRLDYSYFFKSRTYYFSFRTYDFLLSIHQPLIMVNYILAGNNYNFKIGGGAGYNIALLSLNSTNYHSSGLGLRGEVLFEAKLSTKLDSYVSAFINGGIFNTLKDSNGNVFNYGSLNQNVNLSGFGFGVRLGFMYRIF